MSDSQYLQKSKEQKDYYNKTAKDYDKWHVETPSAKIVDRWNFDNLKNFLANSSGKKQIKRSLELGSGTGRLANSLFQISEEVYGVDQSDKVLDIARKKYPRLKLSCAEVINLPYQDNYFDLVIINGSLHHFFAVEKTFAEAHRVLKSGGLFVILGEPSGQFIKIYNPFFYFWLIDRVISKIISIFKKGEFFAEAIEPDAETYKPWILKKQLIKSGFEVKSFYTYDYFVRHNYSLFLKFYPYYLKFENATIAKIFPYLGLAIQAFSIKK